METNPFKFNIHNFKKSRCDKQRLLYNFCSYQNYFPALKGEAGNLALLYRLTSHGSLAQA